MDMTPVSRTNRLHYAWVILGTGTMVVFGALGLARFGYTVVLPPMQAGLSLTNTEAGVLATANLVGYLTLSLIGGALAARYRPRMVITGGLFLAGLGMLLTGLVDSFLPAVLWRTLTGIGSGASNVPVMGLMSAWFASRRRGLASGIAVSGSSIALILIGPLIPIVLTTFGEDGWRVSWFIFGGITWILAVLGWLLLRDEPGEMGLSPMGAIGEKSSGESRSIKLAWEQVYRAPKVWHLGLVYVAFGFSYIIYLTFFTKRLIDEGGYSQGSAGLLFMILGWFSLLCGLIWGGVSDRIGRKAALAIVYLIQAVSYGLFALWINPAAFTISAILFGLTAWSIPAIMAAACGDMLGPRLAPAALGFITVFFGIGQAIGPSVAGALADSANSFTPAYLLASLLALVGAGATLFLQTSSSPQGEG